MIYIYNNCRIIMVALFVLKCSFCIHSISSIRKPEFVSLMIISARLNKSFLENFENTSDCRDISIRKELACVSLNIA